MEELVIKKSTLKSLADCIRRFDNTKTYKIDEIPNKLAQAITDDLDFVRNYIERTSNYSSVVIPNNVTKIGQSAFQNCSSLASVTIPSSVKEIGREAFYYCLNLSTINFPEGLTRIGSSAFKNCSKLTTINFPISLKSISYSAFSDCTNLTTINVPWAEGEVANAPWGATNATINYNYTG